jgi:hypothetical protein
MLVISAIGPAAAALRNGFGASREWVCHPIGVARAAGQAVFAETNRRHDATPQIGDCAATEGTIGKRGPTRDTNDL